MVADNDADEMSYNSGRKCLSVLGFTDSKNVPRDIWLGTGALYITVQKDKLVRLKFNLYGRLLIQYL